MNQSICHSINQSPFSSQIWQDCLANMQSEDCLVMINDGVYGALLNQPYQQALINKQCYVIEEELIKRGLDQLTLNPAVELISYTDWVNLVAKHPLNQSWF